MTEETQKNKKRRNAKRGLRTREKVRQEKEAKQQRAFSRGFLVGALRRILNAQKKD